MTMLYGVNILFTYCNKGSESTYPVLSPCMFVSTYSAYSATPAREWNFGLFCLQFLNRGSEKGQIWRHCGSITYKHSDSKKVFVLFTILCTWFLLCLEHIFCTFRLGLQSSTHLNVQHCGTRSVLTNSNKSCYFRGLEGFKTEFSS